MTHYKIINDSDKLKEFIEWLPDLAMGEKFYLACFARKKYCKDVKYIKTDKAQVWRGLVNKQDLYRKIQQLEVPLNSYEIKGIEIPQEALALYISVNPRSMERATRQSLIKFANLLALQYNGYNPVAECMSEAHKAVSRRIWFDFDFDEVDIDWTLAEILKVLPIDSIKAVKTRSGMHVMVHLPSVDKKISHIWHRTLSALPGCDVRGDNLLPVIGCVQGDFTPHFIDHETFAETKRQE